MKVTDLIAQLQKVQEAMGPEEEIVVVIPGFSSESDYLEIERVEDEGFIHLREVELVLYLKK